VRPLGLREGVFLLLCVFFNRAWAADPIILGERIPFSATRSVGILDQEDCDWNGKLVSEIVRQSKGSVAVVNGAPEGFTGRQLKIEIVDVYAPAGSRFSGDKWITIRGNLIDAGKRVAGFDLSESGNGMTACRALEGVAKDLASDVNDWLKRPLPECAPSCFDRPVADVIRIAAVIPYDGAEAVTEDVRQQCDWNRQAVDTLVQLSNGALSIATEDLAAYKGKKLLIKTLETRTASGSTFSGPKWITVRGELFEQDKLIGSFRSRQRTINGTYEGCATLRSLGRHLAVEVSEWLDDPKMDAKL